MKKPKKIQIVNPKRISIRLSESNYLKMNEVKNELNVPINKAVNYVLEEYFYWKKNEVI